MTASGFLCSFFKKNNAQLTPMGLAQQRRDEYLAIIQVLETMDVSGVDSGTLENDASVVPRQDSDDEPVGLVRREYVDEDSDEAYAEERRVEKRDQKSLMQYFSEHS